MAYVQLRDRIISLLPDEEIENELCCWREFLDGIDGASDAASDAAHEYLNKKCNSEEQSSKGLCIKIAINRLISSCLGLSCPSLVVMC